MKHKGKRSIEELLALRNVSPRPPFTAEERGRLVAELYNGRPLKMTEKRMEARREGGRTRAAGRKDEYDDSRRKKIDMFYEAREKLREKYGKVTYADIANETGMSERTVRRVKKMWELGR